MMKKKLQIPEYTKSKPAELFKQKECHFMLILRRHFQIRELFSFFRKKEENFGVRKTVVHS